MRLGLSHLKQQLQSFGIVPSPFCVTCPLRLETVSHYLLNCPRYTGIRAEMIEGVGAVLEASGINLDINNKIIMLDITLKGHSMLPESKKN